MGAQSFVHDAWYAAAWGTELTTTPLARTILGEQVVLYRGQSGAVAALEDVCPHRMAPLSMGTVEGDSLRCGYHGLLLDGSGTCREIPSQSNIPPRAKARSYPLIERWRLAWIWMGEPAAADPGLIPNGYWLDDEAWDFSHGTIRYDCNYVLLIDNLVDLSHTTFVHKSTIGTDDNARTPVTSKRENGTVSVERVINDTEPSELYKAMGGFKGRVDRWMRIYYDAPAYVTIDAGAVPAGSNDPSRGIATWIINYLTPEHDGSVFHFWAFARDFALGDAKMTELIAEKITHTFNEDLVFLGGQQARMEARPEQRLLDLNADSGVALARKLLDERIKGGAG
ncbi:MAG TPA: aromatic ring-hydroxylating dioxygenase subunit alpha [Alphaproteobacteria bacterium]|nr:aromatic ring-hydroxylating dioxygenase subunit alpha [Alphaproteobacteria bacterium]